MSYASLIKTLPETLGSSTGLAALASLGIHGLLFAVLPLLPLDSESAQTQSQRTVELVELTPADVSRLPQFSQPQDTLPPSNTPLSGLPPLPPAPDFTSILPPLPPAPDFTSILPPLPPPPVLNLPPPSETPIYKYPLTSSLPQPPNFLVPRLSAPLPKDRPFTSRLNVGKLPSPQPFKPPANVSLPNLNLKPAERFSLPDIPPSQITQENTNRQNANQPQNQELPTANQSTKPTTSALPAKLPERGKQELLALQEKLREQSQRNQTAPTRAAAAPQNTQPQVARSNSQKQPQATSALPAKLPERGKQELLALQEKLREQSQPNQTAPSSVATAEKIEQLRTWSERQNTVQGDHPNVVTKAPIYKTLNRCQKELDGSTAVIGVVVNPEGKIISGPDLLDKKGAAGVEEAAKDFVKRYEFPRTDNPTNQPFHLQFKCSKPL